MARELTGAELALREVAKLREVLQQVRYDKSFCCLKWGTQDVVKAALDERPATPPADASQEGQQK